jgi:SAM-dependent methyltransferase
MPTPALTVLEEDKHWWFASRTRAILKYLDAELGPSTPGHPRLILDLGAGAGNMAHHLAHYGRVIGLDYNPRPLPVAQARALTTSQGSGTQLPFADNTFDLIALLDTVEHIHDELAVFAEAQRVLKPAGKLMITVPAYMWLWSYNDVINDHKRRYTVKELRLKLALSGFRTKRASYNNFFVFPLIAGVRLMRSDAPELESPHMTEEQDVYQVEMEPTPEPINAILHSVGWVEAALVERTSLPFGTSILCIAEKADADAS